MATKITIVIDNFEGSDMGNELSRILRGIIDCTEGRDNLNLKYSGWKLLDGNDNVVGQITIQPTAGED